MPVVLSALSPPLAVNSVVAALVFASNWRTLTASVSFVPSATLTILLLPLSRPLPVKDTVSLPGFVIVTPSLVKVALLPAASATVVPVASTLVVSPAAFVTVAPVEATFVVLPAASLTVAPLGSTLV